MAIYKVNSWVAASYVKRRLVCWPKKRRTGGDGTDNSHEWNGSAYGDEWVNSSNTTTTQYTYMSWVDVRAMGDIPVICQIQTWQQRSARCRRLEHPFVSANPACVCSFSRFGWQTFDGMWLQAQAARNMLMMMIVFRLTEWLCFD